VLRALITLLLVPVYTVLFGVACLLGSLLERRGRFCRLMIGVWSRLILRTAGVRVRVSGLENLPPGPAVLAANHASALDIPILFGGLPVDFRIIHKRSLLLVPVIGWCLRAGGHISIDRQNPFRARRSLEAAAERIRRGTSVVVFPEGTRSRDGRIGAFKRGSFALAIRAGAPVLPVSIAGLKRLMPRRLPSLRPGEVRVRLHPAIATRHLDADDADRVACEAREAVLRACDEERAG
jgi:1-acyl-sn-glycerol-3-phosphate acyltransferase